MPDTTPTHNDTTPTPYTQNRFCANPAFPVDPAVEGREVEKAADEEGNERQPRQFKPRLQPVACDGGRSDDPQGKERHEAACGVLQN